MKLKSRGWTSSEEEYLKKWIEEGKNDKEISFLMEKTEDSIRNKVKRMGYKRVTRLPKILLIDIETSPLNVYSWGIFEQNININQINHDWFILCWSAKWLFDDEVISERLTGSEAKKHNDKRIVKKMWDLLSEADYVVAHNGDKFDIKKLNTRFLYHNFYMPSPYRTIDTLKIAKKYFGVSSNKLDYLCRFLGLNTKIETGGFDLWRNCLEGKEPSLKQMSDYCANDVLILEELYLRLKSYDKSHPNVNIFNNTDDICCSSCGRKITKECGNFTTNSGIYKAYRCDCGAITKSNENEKRKNKKDKNKTTTIRNASKKNKTT